MLPTTKELELQTELEFYLLEINRLQGEKQKLETLLESEKVHTSTLEYSNEGLRNRVYELQREISSLTLANADLANSLDQASELQASALKARDEAVDELNSLINAMEIVWNAFPEEVLRDQLGEDFEEIDNLFETYFEDEE